MAPGSRPEFRSSETTRLKGRRLANDGVLHGPKSGGGSCRHTDLVVNVLDVMIGGLRRDEEPIGDRLRRESPRREAQHVDLATREPARISRPLRRGRVWLAVAG